MAADCYSDFVVKGWLEERDRAEKRVVQAWAKGASSEELASDIAIILANELYLCSTCRNQVDFLEEHLHVLNNGDSPAVDTVPARILETFVGGEFLSPWRQFPKGRRGMEKSW
jgi:hypothetical protein